MYVPVVTRGVTLIPDPDFNPGYDRVSDLHHLPRTLAPTLTTPINSDPNPKP